MTYGTYPPSVYRLAVAQALAGANSTVVYASAAIIGHTLAPSAALSTLPITVFVIGMALSTLPAGAIARRFGRRAAFLAGSACGVVMGILASVALIKGSFAGFCAAMLFGGAYAAVVLTFRFAAAESVASQLKPRALSLVLAGGVAAGVLGPQLVNATMALSAHAYAVTYAAAAVLAACAGIVLWGVEAPTPTTLPEQTSQESLLHIVTRPRFLVAMLCGIVSYMLMNFMMTSAPLAMEMQGIPRVHSNLGIEMHVIAMYAPSFFTGRLISRYGASTIVQLGLLLIGLASVFGMTGFSVVHFWAALVLLGIGWNFGFLGASALVLSCHQPEDGPRIQAINDFGVFGTMVVGSFLSGGLLDAFGWATVTALMLPPIILAMATLAWSGRRSKVMVP